MLSKYLLGITIGLLPFCSAIAQCEAGDVMLVIRQKFVGVHQTLNPDYFEGETKKSYAVAARDPEHWRIFFFILWQRIDQ